MDNGDQPKANKIDEIRDQLLNKGLFQNAPSGEHHGLQSHSNEHSVPNSGDHHSAPGGQFYHQPAPFAEELKKRFEKKE